LAYHHGPPIRLNGLSSTAVLMWNTFLLEYASMRAAKHACLLKFGAFFEGVGPMKILNRIAVSALNHDAPVISPCNRGHTDQDKPDTIVLTNV
jgi:hypothetical protein